MGLFPYVGGDGLIYGHILSLFPASGRIDTFVEAFGGAGTITLEVARRGLFSRIIYNDLDRANYGSFLIIKEGRLIPVVEKYLMRFLEWAREPELKERIRRALKTIWKMLDKMDVRRAGLWNVIIHYLSSPGVIRNGLRFRTIDDRTFNEYLYRRVGERLRAYSRILQDVVLRNENAFDLIPALDGPNVLFYLDPPHLGRPYYRFNFNKTQLVKLCRLLAAIKGYAILKASPEDFRVVRTVLDWPFVSIKYQVYTTKNYSTYYFFVNYKTRSLLDFF